VTYDPRDCHPTNGVAASLVFQWRPRGRPGRIERRRDRAAGRARQRLALSFDVPTTIGAFSVEPADLLIMRPVPPFGCGDWVPVGAA
jgi:hypothetical protein